SRHDDSRARTTHAHGVIMDFGAKFRIGHSYDEFLAKYATDEQKRRWEAVHAQVRLSEAQRDVLRSFVREMKVLVVSGAWCGDCIEQLPIFSHFTAENPKIRIHYFDRDDHPDLADALSICGGRR